MRRLGELGFILGADGSTWRSEFDGFAFSIELAQKPIEWWLVMACENEAPRMEFAGGLGGCVALYVALLGLIQKKRI
jgi:hypothetical protein